MLRKNPNELSGQTNTIAVKSFGPPTPWVLLGKVKKYLNLQDDVKILGPFVSLVVHPGQIRWEGLWVYLVSTCAVNAR